MSFIRVSVNDTIGLLHDVVGEDEEYIEVFSQFLEECVAEKKDERYTLDYTKALRFLSVIIRGRLLASMRD